MHVEIKVAQNFVLNFLYNKLPRRRINLFGEELESALRDKFADHWYPDKPFKGSAFRCLKITDPADPVLNRAARESGNPVPDIVENLPTDLAIWIDPGEVSYRIGEKGSVKILYSESLDGSYLQNLQPLDEPSSPEAVAVASATAAAMAAAASFQPKNFNRPHGGHVGGPCGGGMHGGSNGSGPSQNFLPLDNLNLAVGGLTLNSNQPSPGSHPPPFEGPPSQMSPPQQQQQGQGPPELHHTEPPQLPMNVEPRGPGNAGPPVGPNPPGNSGTPPSGTNNGGGSSGGNQNGGGGFVPFQPRSHQPVIYTAGSFAQTKFGSTKLKSNAKKTNRMSPTEFSNYIKQRAMQKQGSLGSNTSNGVVAGTPTNNGSGLMPIGGSAGGNNGSGAVSAAAAAAAAAVVNSNGGFRNPGSNYNNVTVNRPIAVNGSFHGGPHANGGVGQVPGGNLNYGGGSGRIPPHQHQSQDPYFYPLFPDRGQSNVGGVSNGSTNYYQNPQHGPQGHQGGLMSTGSSSESSSASSSSSSSSTTNPWSFVDGDAELFLQDILTVGLTSSGAGNGKTGSTVPARNGSGSGGGSSNLFNEYSSFNDLGNIGSNSLNSGSSSFGSNSSGGSTNSSGSGGSLGLSMLNNIGGLGSYGGNCATNGVGNAAAGGGGGSGGNGANQLVGSGPGLFNNLGLDIVDQALVNAATAAAAAAQQASNGGGGGGNGSDCGNTMGKINGSNAVNNSFNMNPVMGKSGSGVISKDGNSTNQNGSGPSACPEQQKYNQQRVLVAN